MNKKFFESDVANRYIVTHTCYGDQLEIRRPVEYLWLEVAGLSLTQSIYKNIEILQNGHYSESAQKTLLLYLIKSQGEIQDIDVSDFMSKPFKAGIKENLKNINLKGSYSVDRRAVTDNDGIIMTLNSYWQSYYPQELVDWVIHLCDEIPFSTEGTFPITIHPFFVNHEKLIEFTQKSNVFTQMNILSMLHTLNLSFDDYVNHPEKIISETCIII